MPRTAARRAPQRPPQPAPKRVSANLTRPMRPSPELAAVIGPEPRSRGEVTKAVWGYIRAHGLQDPADRRVIVADAALRPIVGERIGQLQLVGAVNRHLTAA